MVVVGVCAYAPASAMAAINVDITAAGMNSNMSCSGGSPDTCTPTASPAVLSASFLDSRIATAGPVIINTGSSGSDAGDISVDAPISATGGDITFDPAEQINLNADVSTAGTETYEEPVLLGSAVTLTGSEVAFDSSLDGGFGLTVDGDATFDGSIGATTQLSSLSVSGGATASFGASATGISTTGAQSYSEAVSFSGSPTFTGGSTTFSKAVNGAGALTVDDATSTEFDATVGGTTLPSSLDVEGAGSIALNAAVINTTGTQTYSGPVTLTTGSSNLVRSSSNAAITFGSSIDGAGSLDIDTNGAVDLDGPIGATTPLVILLVSSFDEPGPTTLGASTVDVSGSVDFEQPVTLTANTTLSTPNNASVTFWSSVSGNESLTKTGAGTMYMESTDDTYNGTTVAGGTVSFVNGGLGSGAIGLNGGTLTWASSAPQDISANGLTIGPNGGTLDTNTYNATLGHGVSGSGTLTKTDSGTLTLAGHNTVYGGAINVAGGAVDLTGFTTTPATVASGATLNLTGAIDAPVTVQSSGALNCSGGSIEDGLTNDGGTLSGAPTAPTGVTATSQNGEAIVSFAPGAANCNPVQYTAAPVGGGASVTGSGSPLTLSGLSYGTPYTFAVTATNPIGSSPAADSSSLAVPGPPTVSISNPTQDATYQLNQVVTVGYTCSEATAGPGISSCTGTAASGAALYTASAGTHTFSVTAVSGDGERASTTITYTVASPSNACSFKSASAAKNGNVSFTLNLAGPGTVKITESASGLKKPVKESIAASKAKFSWKIPASGKLKALIKKARRDRLKIKLTIVYTPTGGEARTVTKTVTT
jgi:autotransporter-associated beta strand protein